MTSVVAVRLSNSAFCFCSTRVDLVLPALRYEFVYWDKVDVDNNRLMLYSDV